MLAARIVGSYYSDNSAKLQLFQIKFQCKSIKSTLTVLCFVNPKKQGCNFK